MGYHTTHWAWLTFFSMQAPIIALETFVRQQLKQHRIHLPHVVQVFVTVAVLLTVADAFFFPPVVNSGLADHVVESIKKNIEGIAGMGSRAADVNL